MQKAIEVAKKSTSVPPQSRPPRARAKAVEAEEQAFTAREREIAERRKLTDLIGARRENEREALRMTGKADAEKAAATSLAEAPDRRAPRRGRDHIKALAAAARYEVDATGSPAERGGKPALRRARPRLREKLLDRIEGIVRESVRPMEKIDGIKILHIDGAKRSGRPSQCDGRGDQFGATLSRAGADD